MEERGAKEDGQNDNVFVFVKFGMQHIGIQLVGEKALIISYLCISYLLKLGDSSPIQHELHRTRPDKSEASCIGLMLAKSAMTK